MMTGEGALGVGLGDIMEMVDNMKSDLRKEFGDKIEDITHTIDSLQKKVEEQWEDLEGANEKNGTRLRELED